MTLHRTLRLAAPAACALFALGCSREPNAAATPPAAIPKAGTTQRNAEPARVNEHASVKIAEADTKRPRTEPEAPRLYAKTRFVWIFPEPNAEREWIGYLWIGGSVPLRKTTPEAGPGCATYYAIEPRGYVCVDGVKATLDAHDPAYVSVKRYAPKLDSAWPHQYAESRGLDRLREIPNATNTLGILPPTIYENRTKLRPQSTFAYSSEVEVEGKPWLLSHDLMWVAKDRVTPYPKVEFHGVELGKGIDLPLAFFRGRDREKYRREASGEFVATGSRFSRLSHVALTNERAEFEKDEYLLTAEPGVWIKGKEAVVPTPRARTPWGAPVGGKDETGITPRGRASWLEVSVWKGWLIAYEGTKAVYATMISPGRGGTPVPDKDPIETASTPTGTFKITGKFATATMEAPNEFIHSDVPWTQNFSGPHAIHGAYWHDDWGNRKSAGCVNVSPVDGRWLYHFTEPVVPEGWHGLRWQPRLEPATTFVVHD